MRFEGKAALVTGGSRGIGRAVAERLARDGATVALTYRSERDQAEAVVSAITAAGGRAVAIEADITDIGRIPAIFDMTVARLGRLDILVNNAGIGVSAPFTALAEVDYDRLFAITKGVYFMLQHAAGVIADNGRIISISTGLTRNWAPGAAAYAGSKAAVEQFSRSLSKEVGPRGITVNVVLPGVTETDMTAGMPSARAEQARLQTSLGRLGRPGDIADVVAFLASEEARWITGQLLVANGGSTP